jgi:transcriptional regulator with XRE-family HTH domain
VEGYSKSSPPERLRSSDIGERVKFLRDLYSLTQKEICSALELSIRHYRRIEKGQILPRVPTVAKIAQFYCVTMDDVVGLTRLSRRYDKYTHMYILTKIQASLRGLTYRRLIWEMYSRDPGKNGSKKP